MKGRLLLLSAFCGLGWAGALAQTAGGAEDRVDDRGPQAAAAQAPDAAALNPLATLDKSGLTGFRDMPLFTPSRKRPSPPEAEPEPEPEPEPQPVQAAPPPPQPELKLTGVIEGPEGAVAVVQKDGETERLRLGDQVDGWLVTGIEGYELKLTLDEREAAYRLFERQEGSQSAAATADGDDSGDDFDADEPAARPHGKRGAVPPNRNRQQMDEPEGAQPRPQRPPNPFGAGGQRNGDQQP